MLDTMTQFAMKKADAVTAAVMTLELSDPSTLAVDVWRSVVCVIDTSVARIKRMLTTQTKTGNQ